MTHQSDSKENYNLREFIMSREFPVARKTLFKAWTDPTDLAQWWGPRGFTNPVCQWEAKPGNPLFVLMQAPNGTEYPMTGQFHTVMPPELLVFTSGALNQEGQQIFELLHTATFAEESGKTLLSLLSFVTKTSEGASKYIGGFEAGMAQSLERLSEYLERLSPLRPHSPDPSSWRA